MSSHACDICGGKDEIQTFAFMDANYASRNSDPAYLASTGNALNMAVNELADALHKKQPKIASNFISSLRVSLLGMSTINSEQSRAKSGRLFILRDFFEPTVYRQKLDALAHLARARAGVSMFSIRNGQGKTIC